MARWRPARTDVIAEYAAEVSGVFPRGRILVGLDGIESPLAGTRATSREAFAADLAAALVARGTPAAAVRLSDFVTDQAGAPPTDPAALYDLAAFRERVVTPYRAGRTVDVAAAGPEGAGTRAFEPGDRAVLVVSGAFAHLGDLAGIWHQSAWLQLARADARAREAVRLGVPEDDAVLERWFGSVDAAFRLLDARKRSNATFDLTDVDHPRRQFEDAC